MTPEQRRARRERRADWVAKVLFETEQGTTDSVAAAERKISPRTIKRWREHERDGRLPEVSLELDRMRAEAADRMKARAEQALEKIFNFIDKACDSGDEQDPRMVEAITKAGEFVVDTLATAKILNGRISSTGASRAIGAQDRAVDATSGSVGHVGPAATYAN